MSVSEENHTTYGGKQVMVLLNKDNYIAWKEAFENVTMSFEDAGIMWRSREVIELAAPDREAAVYKAGQSEELADKMYMNDYNKYTQQVKEFKRGKQTLCGLMMSSLSSDMNERIRGDATFEKIWKDFDMLKLVALIELHATGKGTTSAFVESSRLLKLEQGDKSFANYAKRFREIVASLKKRGKPDEVLDMMINSKFILGVNQEMFKDQLAIVYASEKWPTYQEAIDAFGRYANTKESVENYKNNTHDGYGTIKANLSKSAKNRKASIKTQQQDGEDTSAKVAKDYVCVSCGKIGNHVVEKCYFKKKKCVLCGVTGHKQKYCPTAKINNIAAKDSEDSDENDTKQSTKKSSTTAHLVKADYHFYSDEEDAIYAH